MEKENDPPAEVEETPWVEACKVEALAGNRALVQVPQKTGRYVAVIRHKGTLHALDATCYHMGGPLLTADIEEVGEHGSCIVCPWHRYEISLETGQKVYKDMTGTLKTNGEMKQRVHDVKIEGNAVMVKLNKEGKCASDGYAFKRPAPSQGGGGLRSGHILSGGSGYSAPNTLNRMVANSYHGGDGCAPWGVSAPPLPPPSNNSLPKQQNSFLKTSPILSKEVFISYIVDKVVKLNLDHYVIGMRVLGAPYSLSGLGRHVELQYEGVTRFYTPYQPDSSDRSYVEFFVKVYANGELTPLLSELSAHSSRVSLRGPHAGMPQDVFAQKGGIHTVHFLAGGTGIAPFLQIAYHLAAREGKVHSVRRLNLIWSISSPEAQALRTQLKSLQTLLAGVGVEFTYEYIVATVATPEKGGVGPWEGKVGRITEAMIKEECPPKVEGDEGVRTELLVCGPPAFNEAMKGFAESVGYAEEAVREFA